MISTQNVNTFLDRYGCQVSLATDGVNFNRAYRAFIQPLRYKNKMYLEGTRTRLGHTHQSYYLYVGPGHVNMLAAKDRAILDVSGARYWFSHVEAVRVSDQPVYIWAILRALAEEA